MNLTNPLHAILEQMDKRGGAFVQLLAAAMRKADPENLERAMNAWPEYMECYDGWASADSKFQPGFEFDESFPAGVGADAPPVAECVPAEAPIQSRVVVGAEAAGGVTGVNANEQPTSSADGQPELENKLER